MLAVVAERDATPPFQGRDFKRIVEQWLARKHVQHRRARSVEARR